MNTSDTPLVIALLHLNDHERMRAMIGFVPIWGQVEDTSPTVPQAEYWTIVTLTTVGYGGISSVTPLGKALVAEFHLPTLR